MSSNSVGLAHDLDGLHPWFQSAFQVKVNKSVKQKKTKATEHSDVWYDSTKVIHNYGFHKCFPCVLEVTIDWVVWGVNRLVVKEDSQYAGATSAPCPT